MSEKVEMPVKTVAGKVDAPVRQRLYEKFTKKDLEKVFSMMIHKEPFYATLGREVNKFVTEDVPTAAVGWNKIYRRFDMMFNPEFMAYLTKKEAIAIVKHEFSHIINHHIGKRSQASSKIKLNPRLWNVAVDLYVNSELKNELPPNGVVYPPLGEEPAHFAVPGEGQFENMPPGRMSEWYFYRLYEQADKIEIPMGLDSHDGWPEDGEDGNGNGDKQCEDGFEGSQTQREIDAETRRILKDAYNRANKSNQWGSVSSDMQKKLGEMFSPPKLNWKNVLKHFVQKSQKANPYSTYKKVNKRYRRPSGEPLAPGRSRRRQAKIIIFIDESGSMSDSVLKQMAAEMRKLSEFATFTVVPFDTNPNYGAKFVWKRGQKLSYSRSRCGGTDFSACAEYLAGGKGEGVKERFDGAIIMTDLMAPYVPKFPVQRIWISSQAAENAPWDSSEVKSEIILHVEPEKDTNGEM